MGRPHEHKFIRQAAVYGAHLAYTDHEIGPAIQQVEDAKLTPGDDQVKEICRRAPGMWNTEDKAVNTEPLQQPIFQIRWQGRIESVQCRAWVWRYMMDNRSHHHGVYQ